MARLFRPHIPLSVRCAVAERQMEQAVQCLPTNEFGVPYRDDPKAKQAERLKAVLFHLARILGCEVSELHLDHNPALGAREKVHDWISGEHTGYIPDANDPEFLIYREANAHRIKTNHHGDGAQHPDRVLIKKARRLERGPKPKRPTSFSRAKLRSPKQKWPKRKFEKRRG